MSSSTLPPSAILRRCTVRSVVDVRQSPEVGSPESFYCGTAVDQRRGLFYDFSWEDFKASAVNTAPDYASPGDCWDISTDEVDAPNSKTPQKKPARQQEKRHDNMATRRTGVHLEDSSDSHTTTPRKRKRDSTAHDDTPLTTRSGKVRDASSTVTGRKSRKQSARAAHDDSELPSLKKTGNTSSPAPGASSRRSDSPIIMTPTVKRTYSNARARARKSAVSQRNNPSSKAARNERPADPISSESEAEEQETEALVNDPDYKDDTAEESEEEKEAMDVEDDPEEKAQETEEEVDELEEEEPPTPKTPSRRRTTKTATPRKTPSTPSRARALATPTKPRRTTTLAKPTPHSKAALRRRRSTALAIRPPPALDAGALDINLGTQDPWLRAMHVLHVAARPEALPCREEEYARVLRAVEELLEEGSGGCVCMCKLSFMMDAT